MRKEQGEPGLTSPAFGRMSKLGWNGTTKDTTKEESKTTPAFGRMSKLGWGEENGL